MLLSALWGGYKRGGIVGVYHWIRCHTWNRYHVINLKRSGGDYEWGWVDRDVAMWLACFTLLCDYVEREAPFEFINWDTDEYHAHAGREIKALYSWWRHGRAREHAELEAIDAEWENQDAKWAEYCERVDTLEKKDQEMLDRLMKVRGYLWT